MDKNNFGFRSLRVLVWYLKGTRLTHILHSTFFILHLAKKLLGIYHYSLLNLWDIDQLSAILLLRSRACDCDIHLTGSVSALHCQHEHTVEEAHLWLCE